MRWAVVLALLTCGCRQRVETQKQARAAPGAVRITQFYASKLAVPRGDSALLCYGVENALEVKLSPAIEEIRPSLVRCLSIAPTTTTTFALTATGHTGSDTQSVTVAVVEPPPKFIDLSINARSVKPGETVSFCFKAAHAVRVRGRPGRFFRGGNPGTDCLMHQPQETTKYFLTLVGAAGDEVSEGVAVRVK